MRLFPRTLVVLALASAHIQRAFAQTPSSPPPSSTTGSTLNQPFPTEQPTDLSPTPTPVGGMAYAFDGTQLFVLGGKSASKVIHQFFTLDLGRPWNTSNPVWSSHPYATSPQRQDQDEVLAGGLTPNSQFLITAVDLKKNFNVTVYDAGTQTWKSQFWSTSFTGAQGPFVASAHSPNALYLLDDKRTTFHLLNVGVDGVSFNEDRTFPVPFALSAISISNNNLLMTFEQNGNLTVSAMQLNTKVPATLQALGPPTGRTGHCFVPNADGSIYYVVGGTIIGATTDSGEVWSLDIKARIWTQIAFLPGKQTRTQMACAVKNTTLVIWGGFSDSSQNVPTDNKPLLLNIDTKSWLEALPSSSSIAPNIPGPPAPNNESENNDTDGGSSNVGAIIGGVVGGLAVVALVAGFFVFRRRKAHNMKTSVQVLPRDAPPLPSLSGKNAGGQVNVPMNEYTTITSPFVADDSTGYRGSPGAPPLYGAPALQPVSAPLLNQNQSQNQNKNGSLVSQPVQTYSMPFQAPSISGRPLSGTSNAPTIQSPFEVEIESSAHQPLLPGSTVGPLSSSVGANGLLPAPAAAGGGAFSPSMDAASVDLIPFEPNEEGDQDHSRSNSIVSGRAGALARSGSLSAPVRGKSGSQAHSHSHNRSQGQSDDKAELDEDVAVGRRDSTETLEYLEIS